MIIPSLTKYYDRLTDNPKKEIPRMGFSSQKIHFALVLDHNGNLTGPPLPLGEIKGKKQVPKSLVVPQEFEERAGAKLAPHFMWDNTMYVLGCDNKGKPKRSAEAFDKFRELHHDLCNGIDDDGMRAVLNFLNSWNPEDAPQLENWEEMAGMNLVFMLDGKLEYLHERPAVKDAWLSYLNRADSGFSAHCLVTGEKTSIARLHPAIKGVRGAQQKGAAIVSFNLDAFTSYRKKQSFNAPVGQNAAFGYTTALNYMLHPDSRQKVQIGDATTVFWAERESPVEGIFGMIFNPNDDSADIKDVRDYLESVRKGKMPRQISNDPDMKFYILGLSPNASRISVRFWHVSTVRDISEKIGMHFNDLSIDKNFDNEPDNPGMWHLLRETACLRKTENISPILAGSFMRSILTGADYPQGLLSAVLIRIRADQNVNYLRASMIKAYLTRKNRKTGKKMEVKMGLNKDSTHIAYRLGRLFAVLEKAQKDAVPGALSTIKNRYYGSASATPRAVFPQLLRKTESGGVRMDDETRKTVLEAYVKRKQEEIRHPYTEEKVSIGLLFHVQALLMARFLRGDLDGYPPFIWK